MAQADGAAIHNPSSSRISRFGLISPFWSLEDLGLSNLTIVHVMTKTEDQKPKTDGVAAILLAAGRSHRMGAFKPLLPFGERTVIEACIGNLQAGGVEDVLVVVGLRADELREQLAHVAVRFAVNAEEESEMGVSIARGVEQVRS